MSDSKDNENEVFTSAGFEGEGQPGHDASASQDASASSNANLDDDLMTSAPQESEFEPVGQAGDEGVDADGPAGKSNQSVGVSTETDVWTTAQPNPILPVQSEMDGGDGSTREANATLDSGEHSIENLGEALKAHRSGKKQRKRFIAFQRFINELSEARNPLKRLARLGRFSGDAEMGAAAAHHLVAALESSEDHESGHLLYAIAAAAQIDSRAARPHLIEYSRSAVKRMSSEETPPTIEEVFALAGLESIGSDNASFDPQAIFGEHQAAVEQLFGLRDSADSATFDGAITAVIDDYSRRLGLIHPQRNTSEVPVLATGTAGQPVHETGAEQPMPNIETHERAQPSFDGGLEDEFGLGSSTVSKMPLLASVLGFVGIAAGIAILILGMKTHWGFLVLGPLWTVAGLGLWSEKHAGWLLGIVTYGLNGGFLIWIGLSDLLPRWLLGEGFVAAGLGCFLGAGLMLIPSIRKHYRGSSTSWSVD